MKGGNKLVVLVFLGIQHFMFTDLSCRKCKTCQFETQGLLKQGHKIDAFQKNSTSSKLYL